MTWLQICWLQLHVFLTCVLVPARSESSPVCLALLQPSPRTAQVLLPRWTSTIYAPPRCSNKAFRGHWGCFYAAGRVSGPTNSLFFTVFLHSKSNHHIFKLRKDFSACFIGAQEIDGFSPFYFLLSSSLLNIPLKCQSCPGNLGNL